MPPEVTDKLLEWEQKRRDGTPVSPEELCADTPAITGELRRQIQRLAECDRLLGLEETNLGAAEPETEIPAKIAGFEVRGRLGRGGMADVYDGWDPVLRREVAIKVLRLSADFWPFIRTQELAGRFSREGSVLARLEHPHIVPVYQASVWEARPYIVMGKVGGGTLAQRRDDLSRRGPNACAEFIEKVATAVHAAHEQGVLHRDLKPANILVDAQGQPRVADFGLAKFWTEKEHADRSPHSTADAFGDLTGHGAQPGTPSYMAPEQLEPNRGPVGPATDVWALGVILHELLTGSRPFTGETHRELMDKVCRSPAPSCRLNRKRVPRWLDAVVARCLAKDPASRYASAADLAAELRSGLQRSRRVRWLIGSSAILTLVLAAGVAGGRWLIGQTAAESPSAPVAEVETPFRDQPAVTEALAELAAGREVVFFDESHERPINWVFGAETGKRVHNEPGRLVLNSQWPGVNAVEFLPSLPPGRYRVSATMRHDSAGDFGRVGLYVAGRRWDADFGKLICCIAVGFSDVGSLAHDPAGPAWFRHVFTGMVPTQRHHWKIDSDGGPIPIRTAEETRTPSTDRTLSIELESDYAEASLGPDKFRRIDRRDAKVSDARWLDKYRELIPSNRPMDVFRGGVGIIVYNGTVSIREFRIQPLN